MKRLPLYDQVADIACTLEETDKPARRTLVNVLRAQVTTVERVENGILLRYPAAAKSLFAEFATLESGCCAFFGFDVHAEQMRWEAPPTASELMDALYRFFVDATIDVDSLAI